MSEFATHHREFATKNDGPEVALALAHHDDEKMLNLEGQLSFLGLRVVRIVFTNGDGRELPGYPPHLLPSIRWEEAGASGENSKIAAMDRIDIPDGYLAGHIDQAAAFGAQVMGDPLMIFAPNENDEHNDHRAAHQIALLLGGNSIPVYGMDTLTGLDRHGEFLDNGMYVPLSRRRVRQEKRSYRLNKSQTDGIPVAQRRAMFNALGMTGRRGPEIGFDHAAVVFPANNTTDNPLERIVEVFRPESVGRPLVRK